MITQTVRPFAPLATALLASLLHPLASAVSLNAEVAARQPGAGFASDLSSLEGLEGANFGVTGPDMGSVGEIEPQEPTPAVDPIGEISVSGVNGSEEAINPFSLNGNEMHEALSEEDAIEGQAGSSRYGSKNYYSKYDSNSYDKVYYEDDDFHDSDKCCHDCDCHKPSHHFDDFYHDCTVMECPHLVDMKIVDTGRNGGDRVQQVHSDQINVQSVSEDNLQSTATNEVVAQNSCGCGVSTKKECGNGYTTKKFKIKGCITVNEEVEHHQKSGEKTCRDGRAYKTMECACRCGADGDSYRVPPVKSRGYDGYYVGEANPEATAAPTEGEEEQESTPSKDEVPILLPEPMKSDAFSMTPLDVKA